MAIDNKHKQVRFLRGDKANIDTNMQNGKIDGSDLVITKDTDELVFIDYVEEPESGQVTLTQKPLRSRSKETHKVQLGKGVSIGGFKDGETIEVGMDIDELLTKLFTKRVPATYTKPTITCKTVEGHAQAGIYEVGTSISLGVKGIADKKDAGEISQVEVLQNDSSVATQQGGTTAEYLSQSFVVPKGKTIFTAKATYTGAPNKPDNLGGETPENRFADGTVTSSSVTFTGAYRMFSGSLVGALPEITSEVIRSLSNKPLNPAKGERHTLVLQGGESSLIIAVPASLGPITSIRHDEGNDNDFLSSCTTSKVAVVDASGVQENTIEYNVYSYQLDSPAVAKMTFFITL